MAAGGARESRWPAIALVRPVTVGDHTYVEWFSRFDCDQPDEDKTAAQIRDGVLVPGLRALEERFGTTAKALGSAR